MRLVSSRPLMSLAALALGLSACDSATPEQPSAYQAWADKVATIPLSPAEEAQPSQNSAPVRLPLDTEPPRPAKPASMKVELVSPHQLWDLRNGPLQIPSIEVSEANLPVRAAPAPVTIDEPAPSEARLIPASSAQQTVQLGAYSSQASAESAWARLSASAQGAVLQGLRPQYVPVQTAERTLIRLRVQASTEQARTLCQSLAANDPWCQSARN